MKTSVKKLLAGVIALMLTQLPLQADNDKTIQIDQLPPTAQTLLRNDFSKHKVVLIKMENEPGDKGYEVRFANGGSIEFNQKGMWKEINCEKQGVPHKFIPKKIWHYVKKNWPNTQIVKIEKDRKQYEIELSSDVEITFNKNFKVTDIDD